MSAIRVCTATLMVALFAVTGCFTSHDGDALPYLPPTGPCDPEAPAYAPPRCTGPGRCVDILFVVDNRESMLEEQVSLFDTVPTLVTALLSGDVDGDGTFDITPVHDLHFAAITADLGSGGTFVDGCLSPDFGDDAILGRGRTGRLSDVCGLDIPPFLVWTPGDDLDSYRVDAACSVTMGIFGCPYAQPLDAALKALSESRAPPRFYRDSCGHADGANAGFLRRDSVLVVFLVSDHDDCSVQDPTFFADASGRMEDPGLVCDDMSDRLHDPRRYVDGLSALRSDPLDLIVVPIVGLPLALAPRPGQPPHYDEILADDAMQVRPDPRDPTRLAPSCTVAGRGPSFPPRRYLQMAQALDSQGAVVLPQSVCADGTAAVASTIEAVADRL